MDERVRGRARKLTFEQSDLGNDRDHRHVQGKINNQKVTKKEQDDRKCRPPGDGFYPAEKQEQASAQWKK